MLGNNMRKFLSTSLFLLFLSGCALTDVIPSFWDDNQSSRIVDVYVKATNMDCKQPHLSQVSSIRDDLQWFQLYSESKGWLQRDVLKLIKPMQDTVEDFYKRSKEKQGSEAYCEIKKKLLIKQSKDSAQAVLGRYDL
jgi:hypothetical protein